MDTQIQDMQKEVTTSKQEAAESTERCVALTEQLQSMQGGNSELVQELRACERAAQEARDTHNRTALQLKEVGIHPTMHECMYVCVRWSE